MGKRKDRILAAMSNAGRRVKLDLYAEPSGDLGGSSVQDEVGRDTKSKERAGLPNSPSSSDQKQQNPLQLLGQYSDDEIDEESNESHKPAAVENSSADDNKQVKKSLGEGSEDKDANTDENHAIEEVEQENKDGYVTSSDAFQKPEADESRESDAIASGQLHKDINLVEQTSVAGTSAVQVIGDVSSGWKMVLHEESNRYYYWNIETGETSWEVPQVLAQTTELTFDQKTAATENTQTDDVVMHESMGVELDYYSTALAVDGSVGANMISQSKDAYECEPQMDEGVEGSKSEVLKDQCGATDVSQHEFSSSRGASDTFLCDGNSTVTVPEMYLHGSVTNEEKAVFDLSSGLVSRSEHLLEKLKSLEGSKGHQLGHDWRSKYVLEVEIRLSDFKSLLSCGSSLLPFWLHSDRQLKRLEGDIDKEIYQIAKSQVDEVMAMHISSCRGDYKALGMEHESQADGNQNNVISNVYTNTDTLRAVENDLHNEASFGIDLHAENVTYSGSPTKHLESGTIVGDQDNGTVQPDESISEPGFHAGEDVDMDVDMEVEDAIPEGNTTIVDAFEHPVQPNPPAEQTYLSSEDVSIVPPPPDEEWIPPPPPDNEQVPPPPLDEPPESSYAPTTSYMETVQPLSYTDQYNLNYHGSSFTYYGHTATEVPSSNFYHANETQVDVPHASMYYGAVPNIYNGTASVMVNPVESVAYYGLQDGTIPPGLQDGTIPPVPGVSKTESSQNYCESGPVSDNTLASDRIGSVDAPYEAGEVKVDVSAVGVETDMGSVSVPYTSSTIQGPASISVEDSTALPTNSGTSAAAIATASSTAKVQSKVRNKKRTVAVAPSLRSNKKVSSLVDKWKAAKEEMNDNEEDEPENAYEILERKRQREIEKWRAQQIASGEAKDNANFQPLGGDWREKVKRRKAQAAKEAARTPPEEAETQQKPDLVGLARGLPPGWQAYWDETSKQVYYGNTKTSETTWTRPTK